MAVQVQLCFLLFGTCLFSFLLLLECRKLEGYDFPVFSTNKCPGNQVEWKKRSSAINCTEQNGYMCLPNENLTDLLEFCYIYPRILVQQDLCLYLDKRFSKVNSYNCRRFSHGCPELHYFSSDTYIHQSCMEIENGCFSAEPSCKRQPLPRKTSIDDTTLAIILGVSIPACLLCILVFYMIITKYRIYNRRRYLERNDEEIHSLFPWRDSYKEYRISNRRRYLERDDEEIHSLFPWRDSYKESPNDIAMFDQWKEDDSSFISTKACEEVEKLVKSKNLVIVAGHSGSGKSAIIQHIALKYREQGWTVRRLTKVKDIKNHFRSFASRKTILVFNDPFGKESCDEILINSWQMNKMNANFLRYFNVRGAKLLMSCRNNIMSNTRITHHLVNQFDIVDIDNEKYKFSVDEKHKIFKQYTCDMNLSDKDCDKIVQEKYFPLLCKLYSSNEEYRNKGIEFFTEPVTVLKQEVIRFRKSDKGKYCALALLILFNDDLCISDLSENKNTKKKFKHTLKLCGLPNNTPPSAIRDNLEFLKDIMVKKVGDKYHFYHDLVMEITTQVFTTDYPDETIKSADIGFLRKWARIGDCGEYNDSFTIYLSNNYMEKLAERFFNELFGNHFLDVILNPCMKTKSVVEALTKIIQKSPEKLQLLFKKREYQHEIHSSYVCKLESLYVSKLAFISFKEDITPLFALIVFGHTDFSLECLNLAQQIISNFIDSSLFHAVCCNGSMKLFHIFSNDLVEKFLKNNNDNTLGAFYPIHTLNLYHNYEILKELVKIEVKINSKSVSWHRWTPLLLAVGNDTQKYGDYDHEESGATRRNNTVEFLLSNGADINLCAQNGVSPLYVACENGHKNTVQLLLSNGADINLCKKTGVSPLYNACKNGHDSIVHLLISNGADINLCKEDGASPLHIASQNGHDSTVQLLLSNGADINLLKRDRATPLHIASQNGHDSTMQLLLSNGADINLCDEDGASPFFTACKNGHESTVQLLLSNGADINLCEENGASPFYTACQTGHDSTVQLLLSYGVDINLCKEDGASPLHIASQNGYDSTVQLLLSNGADINLCKEDGASPLYIACQTGHDSTVQLLLSNGADINLCKKDGVSPLYIACENGYDSTVQLLLKNGADINLCTDEGANPFYIASLKKHYSTKKLLLIYGANTNLFKKKSKPVLSS